MTEVFDLEQLGDGRFRVGGCLTFKTVRTALETSRRLFDRHDTWDIDLAAVTRCDSAAVALLVEWMSWAETAGKRIVFRNVPQQLLAIARISEVDRLLPLAEERTPA